MSFWRTETLAHRIPAESLITPFQDTHITQSAYELCMGREAFITSTSEKVKVELEEGESLVIPPGQFALLMTEERVKVPLNAIAFISMRFKVKRRGLINVSGFHVDPGFEGRLKFSVYNAGSSTISVTRGDRLFLIWYASLDGETTDAYGDAGPDQDTITSDDQNVMHGDIASPAELKSQLDKLTHLDVHRKWMLGVIAAALLGVLVRFVFMDYFATPSSDHIERLKIEVINEIRDEISSDDHSPTTTSATSVQRPLTSTPAVKPSKNGGEEPTKTISDDPN